MKQGKVTKISTFNKVTAALIAGLALSNGLLYKQVADIKSEMVTKSAISSTGDAMIELEERMLKLETASPSSDDIKSYLMDNPDTIVKSLAKYRFKQEQIAKQQATEKAQSKTEELFNNPDDPFFGNPNGKHVLVEFMDYNCGHCKKLAPRLEEFVAADPEAKVIIKEFPIFINQPTSAYSAMMGVALSFHKPELYHQYHQAIVSQRRLTRESIDQVISDLGVDKSDLKPYLDKAKTHIEDVRGLATVLGITGTPTVYSSTGAEPFHGVSNVGQLLSMFQ
jgi:protein-disulfide isomerase